MKTFKILIVAVIAFATFQSTNAQSNKIERAQNFGLKTATLKVKGICNMDKRRIETAAYSVAGVTSALWDEYSQILTIKYSVFNKDAADKVQKKIASVGNDTQNYRANDAVYNKLPDCCQYQRTKS